MLVCIVMSERYLSRTRKLSNIYKCTWHYFLVKTTKLQLRDFLNRHCYTSHLKNLTNPPAVTLTFLLCCSFKLRYPAPPSAERIPVAISNFRLFGILTFLDKLVLSCVTFLLKTC